MRRVPSLRVSFWLALAGSLLGPTDDVEARTIEDRGYDCRVIASTRQFPRGLLTGQPMVNASGQVAFLVSVPGAVYTETQIRIGRGDALANGTPISTVVARASGDPDPTIFFDILDSPAIEDSGSAIFFGAQRSPPGQGIYRASASPPSSQPILVYADQNIDPLSPFVGFNVPLWQPLPGAIGSILFVAFGPSGEGIYRDTLLLGPTRGSGPSGAYVLPPALIDPYGIETAWLASIGNTTPTAAVFLNDVIVDQSENGAGGFTSLSINGHPTAFVSYERSGFAPSPGWKLVVATTSSRATYVDADVDPFQANMGTRGSAVNLRGEVAFVAYPTGRGEELLVADGGDVIHRVVCRGLLALVGSVDFFRYQISPRAINSRGQIAFWAQTGFIDPQTQEFETFLMVTPEPDEAALALFALVVLRALSAPWSGPSRTRAA